MTTTLNIPKHLSDQSRVWIFPSARPLSASEVEAMEARIADFFRSWASHGAPVPAAGAVLDQHFVVVAVDDSLAPSGCSIDSLFRTMAQIENDLQIPLLDTSRVFAQYEGRVVSFTREEFRRQAKEGRLGGDTFVYDTTAESLEAIRNRRWIRRAADSWHASLL